jgi:hypothetical protein
MAQTTKSRLLNFAQADFVEGVPMSSKAIAVVEHNHVALLRLAHQIRSVSGEIERRALFSDFSKTLIAHISGLESVLLPTLVDAAKADESFLSKGAQAVRAALAAAVAAQDGAAFDEAMATVELRLKEQVAAERARLFPLLGQFSEGEQELLGAELELEEARYVTQVSRANLGRDGHGGSGG